MQHECLKPNIGRHPSGPIRIEPCGGLCARLRYSISGASIVCVTVREESAGFPRIPVGLGIPQLDQQKVQVT